MENSRIIQLDSFRLEALAALLAEHKFVGTIRRVWEVSPSEYHIILNGPNGEVGAPINVSRTSIHKFMKAEDFYLVPEILEAMQELLAYEGEQRRIIPQALWREMELDYLVNVETAPDEPEVAYRFNMDGLLIKN